MTGTEGIRLPAAFESLPSFVEFASRRAGDAGIPPERILEIQLIVEEALVNVIRYAYPEEGGDVELRFGSGPEGGLTVEIRDSGIPFDPTAAPAPDTESDLESRKVGGLGIHLMRQMAQSMAYRREGGENVLVLEVR